MTVLAASAVLAHVHDEPGADVVAEALPGAVLGAANLAVARLRQLLKAVGVRIEPVTEVDAELAGALRALLGGKALSLGDRCCLALTARTEPPAVLTADRVWAELDLPIRVLLVR